MCPSFRVGQFFRAACYPADFAKLRQAVSYGAPGSAELSYLLEGHGDLDREVVSENVEAARTGERAGRPGERARAAAADHGTFHCKIEIPRDLLGSGTGEGDLEITAPVGQGCHSIGVLEGVLPVLGVRQAAFKSGRAQRCCVSGGTEVRGPLREAAWHRNAMTAQGSLDGLAFGLRQGRDLRDWLNRKSGNAQELTGFEKLELEPSAELL